MSPSIPSARHERGREPVSLTLDGPLLLVGAGRMGGAMLEGWIARGLDPARIAVLDPSPPDEMRAVLAQNGIPADHEFPQGLAPTAVLLAVKPQVMRDVLARVAPRCGSQALVISVAAGIPISAFESAFGADQPIVRAMPNTPAAIGRGMIVACPNGKVSGAQKDLADSLLSAGGEVAWIEDEGLMDAVTAVSGSGPAYVFHLVEAMAEAGRAAGLPEDLAMRLARVTVAGAGELLRRAPESAATLRRNVTSPGGTTAAALSVLTAEDGLTDLMRRAVEAAARRSRELGREGA